MLNSQQTYDKHFQVLKTIEQEVTGIFPLVSRNGKTLTLSNVKWVDHGLDVMNDVKAHKQAKINEGSIQSKLTADVEFKDAEGKILDSKRGYTLLTVPHVTARNSYIMEGNEIQVINQLRLRPGLYTSNKGEDLIETHLNTTAAGSYKVMLDRKTGVIRFKSGADKKVPIYSVLQALGNNDSAIKELLGDLYEANVKAAKPEADVEKLMLALNRYAEVRSTAENQIQIREFLASKPLDPKVNQLTTGKPGIDKIDLSAVREATRKCIEVSNGSGDEDDTESLAFKSIHSIEDFLPERIRRAAPVLQRAIQNQMNNKEAIASVMPSTLLGKSVKDFMTTSQFTRYSDQNNPVDINSISTAITILGDGGIGNTRSITDNIRAVHPSQFGVVDPMHSQEGQSVGVALHLSLGAKKVGNELHLRVFDVKTGNPVQMSVSDSMLHTIAFADQYNFKQGTPPTPKKPGKVKVRIGNRLDVTDPANVEYLFNDAASFFSSSTNAVPFMNSNTANRVGMADKHIEQSVQLANPDTPLVHHRLKGTDKGYLELFGEGMLIKSPVDGKVKRVKKDEIIISTPTGDVPVSIHNNYPLNSKTFLSDKPVVKTGQTVKKGQILVENNFTKDRTLALGKNLITAMVPYKGYNFEDGTVISYKAAQKLASVHKEEFRIEKGSDVLVGLEDYLANFPKSLDNLRDNFREMYDNKGVIKKGTKVRKDDIVIPALHEVTLRKTSLVDLHKKLLSNTYSDISAVWTKDVEGEVVDVVHSRKFVKVIVKSVEPAVVGDKVSSMAASKGIITKILSPEEVYKDEKGNEIDVLFNPFGCHSSDTEILTEGGWKLIKDVTVGDKVMGMDPVTQEARLETVEHTTNREYEGVMYKVKNRKLDFVVTPNHRLYARKSSKIRHNYGIIDAEDAFGKRLNYKKNCSSWEGSTPKFFTLDDSKTESHDFASFIGLLIGDGWASQSKSALDQYSYKVFLCQSETKPDVCDFIQELVDRLPWKFTKTYRQHNGMYEWQCSNKALHSWVTQHVGVGAKNKRVPRELLGWCSSALSRVLDGLIMTDGNVKNNPETGHYGTRRYFTSSEKLADDVQELILRTGRSAHITEDLRKAGSGLSKHDSLIYTVHELKSSEPSLNWSDKTKKNATEEWINYSGTVHCVTVPSGMIYTRRNKIPMWGGNSVGRINPGLMLEAAAGKVAEKTGKTFYVDNFNMEHDSHLKDVQDQLKKAKLSDEETIVNEATGHRIPKVLVGPLHTLKLKHKIDGKFSARATGAYTTLEQPKKESGESAQRIAPLTTFSLLSGDAMHFLDDAFRIKSQKNDDYWTALQLGHTLPAPKTPFVADKFVAMLLAAGVNLNQSGDQMQASPMTDAEILRMSHGEVKSSSTLKAPALTPIKGGLFDPDITGGIGGDKFTHIELTEPVISPLMWEAAISVGGFKTGVELEQVINHESSINAAGEVVSGGDGASGIEAVRDHLSKVDLDKAIASTADVASRAKATALNKANRKLRYLKALKKLDLRPEDAYINKYVPVLPPKFRQISEMPDGSVSVADANHGYKEVLLINEQLAALKELGYDASAMKELRTSLKGAVTSNVGLGNFQSQGRQYRGIIEELNGANESKYGFFKSKLQSRPQDLSGRSTVIPNPKLDMDHIGIPKKMAFKIYQPFLIRGLVQNGFTPLKAKEMVADQSPEALSVLEEEIQTRPVLMNRAPELHKFSILAFKPKLIDGKAIETNQLIIEGFGMDHDGDTVGIHVPVSEEAKSEALTKMLPSQSLIATRSDYVIHMPGKETVLGVYLMTAPKGKPVKVKTMAEGEKLVATGKAQMNTALQIGNTVHCVGQKIISELFPAEIRPGLIPIDAKQLEKLVNETSQILGNDKAAKIINKLKDLGNHYVTELGYAVSLKDLEFDYKKRDVILSKIEDGSSEAEFSANAESANAELEALLAAATDNRFVEATFSSKATGKGAAVRQMVASPVAMTDMNGKLVPFAVRKSFAEGHDLGSYLGTTPGARKGMIDKGLTVADTGYLSRLLVNANISNKVTTVDCGTMDGETLPVTGDVINRYGAKGELRNKLITSSILNQHKRSGEKYITVRSPLKCRALNGICSRCAGASPEGKQYNKGYHIGSMSAQAVGERATQVTLSSFHTAGALGGAKVGFPRIKELLHLPQSSKGRAILSEESGTVTGIRPSPAGGFFVTVNRHEHFIPKELGVAVKLGETVTAGKKLSRLGNINPQDLLSATGDMDQTRETLIDELQAAYGKQKIKRRIFENVVKPMTDKAKVSNQGDGATLFNVYAGETHQINTLKSYNETLKKKGLRTIKYEPILLGIPAIPHHTDDFIGQLTHERLKDTVKGSAAYGKGTNITSGHTAAQLVLKQFGHVEDIKNPAKKLF